VTEDEDSRVAISLRTIAPIIWAGVKHLGLSDALSHENGGTQRNGDRAIVNYRHDATATLGTQRQSKACHFPKNNTKPNVSTKPCVNARKNRA